MKLKTDYYILIPKGEWERFSKSLNKAFAACSRSVRELGNAFGRVAKILKVDIDKVEKAAIEKARRRQRIQWRKLSK